MAVLIVPALAVLAVVALLMSLFRHRQPTERTVHIDVRDAMDWLETARARAERLGFQIVEDVGLTLALKARREALRINVYYDGAAALGRVVHKFTRPFPGDPGHKRYAEDVVAFVAGQTATRPSFRPVSYAALSAFVAGVIAPPLLFWPSLAAMWSVATGAAALLALLAHPRTGARYALGAVGLAIVTLVAANVDFAPPVLG